MSKSDSKVAVEALMDAGPGDELVLDSPESRLELEFAYVDETSAYKMLSVKGDDVRVWVVREKYLFITDNNNELPDHVDPDEAWELGKGFEDQEAEQQEVDDT